MTGPVHYFLWPQAENTEETYFAEIEIGNLPLIRSFIADRFGEEPSFMNGGGSFQNGESPFMKEGGSFSRIVA